MRMRLRDRGNFCEQEAKLSGYITHTYERASLLLFGRKFEGRVIYDSNRTEQNRGYRCFFFIKEKGTRRFIMDRKFEI